MKTDETVKKIKSVLEYLDLGTTELNNRLGLTRGRIGDLAGGRVQKFPSDVAAAIVRNYPSFSYEWLMFGKGEMLVDTPPEPTKPSFTGGKHGGLTAEDIESLAPIIEMIAKQQAAVYEKQLAVMTERYEALLKRYEDRLEALTLPNVSPK